MDIKLTFDLEAHASAEAAPANDVSLLLRLPPSAVPSTSRLSRGGVDSAFGGQSGPSLFSLMAIPAAKSYEAMIVVPTMKELPTADVAFGAGKIRADGPKTSGTFCTGESHAASACHSLRTDVC